ncbi:hypothetical protein GOY07_03735 [Wolbachia endosymbiont of Litomosoides sigmodontis]|uniref:hypothetical protein n=1 Tax=Wolbachia endosymbiont of Litomosoides sigmodontis TaxID=80850 RepID=UPI00158EBA0D|nr:hypothetical protein [Wolbachia endosymbiont of Litomosoides sigmodontis]QKX03250.1 hypothetical protein GOY07_03735 [Wolbachia endosymbiont of Litomosoides sigmodontis]
MVLRSKLLDKKVVESKSNAEKHKIIHILQKIRCCNCSKKHNITAIAKICFIFKNSTNCMGKAPKI